MKEITIAVPFARQTLAGVRALGYDQNRLLKSCGIAPALIELDQARIPLDAFIRLLRQTMQWLNDEAVGLFPRPQRLGTFELLTRAVLHETSLGAAIARHATCCNLLDSGLEHEIQQTSTTLIYTLRRHPGLNLKNQFAVESVAMTTHRFLCWLCQRRIPLLRVDLDYPAPAWEKEYVPLFYAAPVYFNQPTIRMVFRLEDMQWPTRRDVRSLERYLSRAPRDVFRPWQDATLGQKVRRDVLRHLQAHHAVPRIEDSATRLSLHPQTLRRRLAVENTDYTQIRTQVRRDLAISLLSEGKHRIDDIAVAIGFSESSAFIRAFKTWTGMTPLHYSRL